MSVITPFHVCKLSLQDFYDYKVQGAEGFSKRRLFEILDDLEVRSRPIMEAARAKLTAEKGAAVLEPYNLAQALSGDIEKCALIHYQPSKLRGCDE